MSKNPTKQKLTRTEERAREDAGKGISPWPSDNAFELPWHENDPAWAWLDAVYAVDKQDDPAPLLALLGAPANVMPFVKDLFDRKLGPLKHKRGPKIPLWRPGVIERAARMMRQLIEEEGLTIEAAADRVLRDYPWIAKELAREKQITRRRQNAQQQTPQEKLKDHYSGDSGHGRRARKRRP